VVVQVLNLWKQRTSRVTAGDSGCGFLGVDEDGKGQEVRVSLTSCRACMLRAVACWFLA
jgi:hypothetical protein